ncbi:sphingolipid 8-(E)-desaturase [Malassezia furfur]|uniref:Delta 8-(E)-sphingolipid desaturase n=1 Tax=Malassezia furfur TaxID=55194 RepID=A0ABY8EWA3_MALFU|nr:SLD [Malassezia furfur]WFD49888.1 sphingolipid 8-(E)-desaturase [Malassezia furfur]
MGLPTRVLTRAQIAERIAQGEVLVLHRRLVYKLDNWVNKHPGGDLAILHFVGRDAKDEIEVYHSAETIATLMRHFAIAQLAEEDATDLSKGRVYRPLMPPIQLGYRNGRLDHPDAQLAAWHAAQGDGESACARIASFPLPVALLEPPPSPLPLLREAQISAAFEQLHAQIRDAGLYELRPHHYARESVRYVGLAVLSYVTFQAAKRTSGVAATLLYLVSAAFLGLMWHQLTFVAHDAGHTSMTHDYATDRFIGVFVASFLGGLSLVWWCDNHDVHHLVTNHPEHDPDIQHMPIFAVSPRFVLEPKVRGTVAPETAPAAQAAEKAPGAQAPAAQSPEKAPNAQTPAAPTAEEKGAMAQGAEDQAASAAPQAASAAPPTSTSIPPAAQDTPTPSGPKGLWSSYYRRVLYFDAPARVLLRFQHKLYYIIMSLARFNLYALSYSFLLLRARRDRWFALECFGLVCFWTWFGAGVLRALPSWGIVVGYLLVSHVFASPVHVQIVLSHFAQDTTDLGPQECFASRQIRTTMDVQCSPALDFVHGGLHMQVTHHLFPRLPRHNLREARDRFVRPFCTRYGLVYEERRFAPGNGKVLARLKEVADQVAFLACVAQAQARGELHS